MDSATGTQTNTAVRDQKEYLQSTTPAFHESLAGFISFFTADACCCVNYDKVTYVEHILKKHPLFNKIIQNQKNKKQKTKTKKPDL